MKGRKPTPKQKVFAAEYVKNKGNGTQAALKAYDTDDERTASVIAVENLGKPRVQNELARLLKESDVTVKRALEKVSDAMDAETVKGEPDHAIRLRSADMSLKLNSAYPDRQQSFIHRHAHLHLVEALDDLPIEEIDAELEKLKGA